MPTPPPNIPFALIADHGPIYAETVPGRFPVEPWATLTNLIFLAVILYWARRLRGQYRRHLILTAALPLLTIGWVGGTVYHATRSHDLWLLLDWNTIVVLILLAAYWLWRRLLPATILSVFVALIALLIPIVLAAALSQHLAQTDRSGISASYAILAAGIAVPATLHCTRRRDVRPLFGMVLASFAAAVAFRSGDIPLARLGWPHGSHYLWHLFGGVATFFMFAFLYRLRENAPEPRHHTCLGAGDAP